MVSTASLHDRRLAGRGAGKLGRLAAAGRLLHARRPTAGVRLLLLARRRRLLKLPAELAIRPHHPGPLQGLRGPEGLNGLLMLEVLPEDPRLPHVVSIDVTATAVDLEDGFDGFFVISS